MTMHPLLLQYRAAQDSDFKARVAVALLRAAVDISTESDATPGHDLRAAWAQTVIADPDGAARRYTPHVMTNATIASDVGAAVAAGDDLSTALDQAVPDDNIVFQVESLVNTLAGV